MLAVPQLSPFLLITFKVSGASACRQVSVRWIEVLRKLGPCLKGTPFLKIEILTLGDRPGIAARTVLKISKGTLFDSSALKSIYSVLSLVKARWIILTLFRKSAIARKIKR